jgi:hypothetical protein
MGNGSIKNYDFASKNMWRKWVWNRIDEKVMEKNNTRKDSVILYLPGPEPHDLKIALDKGFKSNNILAVDLDANNIETVRKRGGLGINADICDVLIAWDEKINIDVLLVDFCCGITQTAIEFIESLLVSGGIHNNTVLAINLLRGRDGATQKYREEIELIDLKHRSSKHRAVQFFWCYMRRLFSLVPELSTIVKDRFINKGKLEDWIKHIEKVTKPNIYSYKSVSINEHTGKRTVNIMDSAVFFPCLCKGECKAAPAPKAQKKIDNAKRKLAAWKAIRTMRLAA